jgi:hypothetical protein
MIAPLLQSTSPSKRQKRSPSPNKGRYHDEGNDESTLGGIEDHVDSLDDDEEDDDDSYLCKREGSLLDHVLAIYDQYEEDSLVEQSHLRLKLTTCGLAKVESLQTRLADAKIKCSLFKVLTLLLQSDSSRLKGPDHAQRIDLMLQVKRIVLDHDLYSVKDVKSKFTCLFSSLRRDLFPPFSIVIPTTAAITTAASPGVSDPASSGPSLELDQLALNQETLRVMTRLEEAAKKSLEQRLAEGEGQHSLMAVTPVRDVDEEQDWDSMREVWYVWLQFPATSGQQLAVWQETLVGEGNLSVLLWNLSYYLSLEGS